MSQPLAGRFAIFVGAMSLGGCGLVLDAVSFGNTKADGGQSSPDTGFVDAVLPGDAHESDVANDAVGSGDVGNLEDAPAFWRLDADPAPADAGTEDSAPDATDGGVDVDGAAGIDAASGDSAGDASDGGPDTLPEHEAWDLDAETRDEPMLVDVPDGDVSLDGAIVVPAECPAYSRECIPGGPLDCHAVDLCCYVDGGPCECPDGRMNCGGDRCEAVTTCAGTGETPAAGLL